MKFYILVLVLVIINFANGFVKAEEKKSDDSATALAALLSKNNDDACSAYGAQSQEVKWNDSSIPAIDVCQNTISCANAYEEYTDASTSQKTENKDLQKEIDELKNDLQEATSSKAEKLNGINDEIIKASQALEQTKSDLNEEYIKHDEETQKLVDELESKSKAKATERTTLITTKKDQLERNALLLLQESYKKCHNDSKEFHKNLVAENKAIASVGNTGKSKQSARSNKKLKEETYAKYNDCLKSAASSVNNQKTTTQEEMADQLTKINTELESINKELAVLVQKTNPQKLAQFTQRQTTAENIYKQTAEQKDREKKTIEESTQQKVQLLSQQIAAKESEQISIKDKKANTANSAKDKRAKKDRKAKDDESEDSELVDKLYGAQAACCNMAAPKDKRLIALFPQVAKKVNQKTPSPNLCNDKRVKTGSGNSSNK
ncbi:MAG: hypothetical protein V4596_09730 [Bdellovibrionota bacterium]